MEKFGKQLGVLILFFSALAGCESSVAYNTSHPDRKAVTIDGDTINVVPLSDHWVSWWAPQAAISFTVVPPLSTLKPKQIRAIEEVSGCTVISAEYQPMSMQAAYLQASVKC